MSVNEDDPVFVVTYRDLILIERWQFDSLWSALGKIVQARAEALRRATRATVQPPVTPMPVAVPTQGVQIERDDSPGQVVTGATTRPVALATAASTEPIREPVRPSPEDEALFAVIRADPTITMSAAERAVGLAPSRGIQRIKLLDGYGTLPADVKEWREARSKTRGVAKGTKLGHKPASTHPWKSRPADPIGQAIPRGATEIEETFEERRLRVASERHAAAWSERHPDATA